MSTIRYFIPEDGDNEACPNVFLAPKSTKPGYPPSLGQIKSSFPLPGRYHFRFKTSLVPGGDSAQGRGSGMAVWMDTVDDSQPVGVWKNSIIAKVTRISYDDSEGSDEEEVLDRSLPVKSNGLHHSHSQSAPASVAGTPRSTPPPSAGVVQAPVQEDHLNIFDDSPRSSMVGSARSSSGNLLDGMDDGNPPPNVAALSSSSAPDVGGEATLLDMNHHGPPSTASSGTAAHDPFGAGASNGGVGGGAGDDLLGMSTAPPPQHQPATTAGRQQSHHGTFGMPVSQHHPPHPASQQQPPPPPQTQRTPNNSYGGSISHPSPPPPSQHQPSSQATPRNASGSYGMQAQAPRSGPPSFGGVKPAQQQQGGRVNSNGSKNAFENFSAQSSPFAEFGNFT